METSSSCELLNPVGARLNDRSEAPEEDGDPDEGLSSERVADPSQRRLQRVENGVGSKNDSKASFERLT